MTDCNEQSWLFQDLGTIVTSRNQNRQRRSFARPADATIMEGYYARKYHRARRSSRGRSKNIEHTRRRERADGFFVADNGRTNLTVRLSIRRRAFAVLTGWSVVFTLHKKRPNTDEIDKVLTTLFIRSLMLLPRDSIVESKKLEPMPEAFDPSTTTALESSSSVEN